jgi:hypothetical protein
MHPSAFIHPFLLFLLHEARCLFRLVGKRPALVGRDRAQVKGVWVLDTVVHCLILTGISSGSI